MSWTNAVPPPLPPYPGFPVVVGMPRVFARKADLGVSTALYFWGGVGLVLLAGLGLFAAIHTRVGALQLQLMANVPTLLAIGCFIVWWRSRRAPLEVIVSETDVMVRGRHTEVTVALPELAMATVHSEPFTAHRRLNLFDRNGRRVAMIPDAIQPFDELVEILQRQVALHADDQTAAVRLRKSRRQAFILVAAAVLFGGLAVTLNVIDRGEARDAKLLAEQGQPATARMVRHFTAPNGVTRRVEYRVTDATSGKSADHNVEVDPDVWPLLKDAAELPVFSVPGRPDVAKLKYGEVRDDLGISPGQKLLLYIAMGVLCLFLLVAGLLNWRGIDIDRDSKTGKFSIKRFGEGR